MKTKLTTLILMLCIVCFSCGRVVQEPQRVIIANNEIITIEQLLKHEKEEYIKALHNGVSDEKREQLLTIFGEKLPPKELIVYVELFTEEKKLERKEIKRVVIEHNERHERFIRDRNIASIVGPKLNANDTAVDFTVRMLDGATITLSDLRGQVVLLYFWGTRCPPCIRHLRTFPSKFIEPFENSAFVLLPIATRDSVDRIERVVTQQGIDFNVGVDPDGSIFHQYVRSGVPQTFLIDKEGVVRSAFWGGSSEAMNNIVFMIERMLIASAIDELLIQKNLSRTQHILCIEDNT